LFSAFQGFPTPIHLGVHFVAQSNLFLFQVQFLAPGFGFSLGQDFGCLLFDVLARQLLAFPFGLTATFTPSLERYITGNGRADERGGDNRNYRQYYIHFRFLDSSFAIHVENCTILFLFGSNAGQRSGFVATKTSGSREYLRRHAASVPGL